MSQFLHSTLSSGKLRAHKIKFGKEDKTMAPKHSRPMTKAELSAEEKENDAKESIRKGSKRRHTPEDASIARLPLSEKVPTSQSSNGESSSDGESASHYCVWKEEVVSALAKGEKLDQKKFPDLSSCVQVKVCAKGQQDLFDSLLRNSPANGDSSSEEERVGDLLPAKHLKAFKKSVIGLEATPPPSPGPDACPHCRHTPCVVDEEAEDGSAFVDCAMSEDLPPNSIRCGLYRLHARALGCTIREPLPQCVMDFIMDNFPDPQDHCTGFRGNESV